MRARLGRIVAYAPADTWFFLGISAFAAVLMLAYWFWTYEWAGTTLLLGFAVASGVNGLRLLLARPPRRGVSPRRPSGASGAVPAEARPVETRSVDAQPEGVGPVSAPGASGVPPAPGPSGAQSAPGGESALELPDADRPFLDERGRLPAPSIAPLAIALAAALIATSIVLGPWLLVIAILPLAWGAIGWLRDAGAEYRAIDAEDAPREVRRNGRPEVAAASPTSASPGGRPDRPAAPGDAPSRP